MTRTEKQQVAAILRRAAYLIAEYGHCKRAYARGPEGQPLLPLSPAATSFCAQGALQRAADDLYGRAWWIENGWGCCEFALEAVISDRPVAVPLWNDQPERTADDVITAMHRAAEQLDPKPQPQEVIA
jgi:hypothetical protein